MTNISNELLSTVIGGTQTGGLSPMEGIAAMRSAVEGSDKFCEPIQRGDLYEQCQADQIREHVPQLTPSLRTPY